MGKPLKQKKKKKKIESVGAYITTESEIQITGARSDLVLIK